MADEKKTGMKPDFLMYNILGYRPTEVSFQFDMEQVSKMIQEIASREIDGIDCVTWELDRKEGIVTWIIWFDANSPHFKDSSTVGTLINTKLDRMSQEMQNFCRKYGSRQSDFKKGGDNKVNMNAIRVRNVEREIQRPLTGIRVSINAFIATIFDYNGVGFKAEYGLNCPKTRFNARYNFSEGSSGKYHHVNGIVVTKSVGFIRDKQAKPKAKLSGSFN